MPPVSVIFGTGPLGLWTAKTLLDQGKPVRLVNTRGNLEKSLQILLGDRPGWEVVKADAMDPAQVQAVTSQATHIYFCMNILYQDWDAKLPLLQRNLVDAALAQGIPLAVGENLYSFSQGLDVMKEGAPEEAPSRKGRLKKQLHEELITAGKDRGLKWTSVRASDFYGPGCTGQSLYGTERFLEPLFAGKKALFIGKLDLPHSYTYIGDYARALVTAAQNPQAWGQYHIVPNAPAPTTRELANLFAAQARKPLKFTALPRWGLRLLGLFNPMLAEIDEVLYQKEEPYIADGSSFEKTYGLTPKTLEEGVRETLRWFKMTKNR